jgi:dUTP pyrophosphatase
MLVKFKHLKEGIILPEYKTGSTTNLDLATPEEVTLEPGCIKQINLGFSVEVPEGFEMQIRSRYGCAMQGLIVLNQPATVDADFKEEIGVLILNLSPLHAVIPKGGLIAQAVLNKVERIEWDEHRIFDEGQGEQLEIFEEIT